MDCFDIWLKEKENSGVIKTRGICQSIKIKVDMVVWVKYAEVVKLMDE